MAVKKSSVVTYLRIPFVKIRIGGKKVDHYSDGSKITTFYGLRKIINKIKTLASRT
ncbi:MAG: hypothetical protein KAS78_03635 [Candidatus Pacebacteria bacterium]|nr:hypothetical protein [Candidatus Paceibacterota bacterium]